MGKISILDKMRMLKLVSKRWVLHFQCICVTHFISLLHFMYIYLFIEMLPLGMNKLI